MAIHGVRKRVPRRAKTAGSRPRSAMPSRWYAPLLSWASNIPTDDSTAPASIHSIGQVAVRPSIRLGVHGADRGHERQHVARRNQNHRQRQRQRERPLRPLHLAGHGAGAVPVVEVPEERVEEEPPVLAPPLNLHRPPPRPHLGRRHRRHQHERRQGREPQRHRAPPDDAQAGVVHQGQEHGHADHRARARPAARVGHGGDDAAQVVGGEGRVRGDVDDAAEVFPRAEQRAGERAEGAVGPPDEAAVAGERGGELGRDERLRHAPREGEDEEAEEREERARRMDRLLRAVWAAGHLEVDEEDEREHRELAPPVATTFLLIWLLLLVLGRVILQGGAIFSWQLLLLMALLRRLLGGNLGLSVHGER
ncbi:hypothetical protein U9M48_007530 [Paspalum notatum var. saurae]|uniref:Uncharacterized protein n=1 Tax=Paspalum notatum var. saurae TaxID=547442 RepID=A0AAQ3Q0P3_PASNO